MYRGKVPFSSHYIKGTCYQQDLCLGADPDYLADVVFVTVLHSTVAFYPFSTLSSLKGSPRRVEYLNKLFESLLHGRFASSLPLLIYPVIYLY